MSCRLSRGAVRLADFRTAPLVLTAGRRDVAFAKFAAHSPGERFHLHGPSPETKLVPLIRNLHAVRSLLHNRP